MIETATVIMRLALCEDGSVAFPHHIVDAFTGFVSPEALARRLGAPDLALKAPIADVTYPTRSTDDEPAGAAVYEDDLNIYVVEEIVDRVSIGDHYTLFRIPKS